MHRLKILPGLCFLFLLSGKGFAQQSDYADSILNQLKLIKGSDSKDSMNFQDAIALMKKNRKEVLLENKSIIRELDHLQTILDEGKYHSTGYWPRNSQLDQ